LYPIVQTAVPEAMVSIDEHQDHFTKCILPNRISAIGIGPGLGLNSETIDGFAKLIADYGHLPMVVDADALNILATRQDLFDQLAPERSLPRIRVNLTGCLVNRKIILQDFTLQSVKRKKEKSTLY
jgi:NAD(P)H-hydrate epimerase